MNEADNNIVKALKICTSEYLGCEDDCPYANKKLTYSQCKLTLAKDVLELLNRRDAEVELLKQIQQKVLSEQNSYTTNDKTVCDDCERILIDNLLKTKFEVCNLFAEKIFESVAVYKFEDKSEEYRDGFMDAMNWYNGNIDTVLKELIGELK